MEPTYPAEAALAAPVADVSAPADAAAPVYPSFKESWAALGWFLLLLLPASLLVFSAGRVLGVTARHSILATLLATDLAKAGVCVFLWWYAGRRRPRLRLWAPREQPLVYVGLAVVGAAQLLLRTLTQQLGLPTWQLQSTLRQLEQFPVASVVTICLCAPVFEEVLFRGLLLPGLLKNYGPGRAILQSSLLFGLFHLNPGQALASALLGLLLGWVYWRTGSLLACIWLHFLNNAAAWWLNHASAGPARQLEALAQQWPGAVGALAVLVAGIWGLHRLTQARSSEPVGR